MKQMKSKIFSLVLCALCAGASAQTITVADVEALPGETVAFSLNLTGGKADTYIALQFDAQFPVTGFTTTGSYSVSSLWPNATSDVGTVDATGVATIPVSSSKAVSTTDVEGLFTVNFTVGNDVALGDYDVTLKNGWFGYGTNSKDDFDNVTFQVHVVASHTIVLDENSTDAPEAATNVNVNLQRTIKANQWSTICLPFSATGEQVKDAFGDDVELAAFTAWESEEDDERGLYGINVSFTKTDANDGISANTPMLIRVSLDITTAMFEDVTLAPENEPVVQVGKKSSERGKFYGTYVPTLVPEENVFISGNKFWYSTGASTIKGYRGYFEFRDVLDAYYDAAAVKYNFFVDGDETQVNDIVNGKLSNGTLFDLSGRKVMKPAKSGLYIVNGKKTIIK